MLTTMALSVVIFIWITSLLKRGGAQIIDKDLPLFPCENQTYILKNKGNDSGGESTTGHSLTVPNYLRKIRKEANCVYKVDII